MSQRLSLLELNEATCHWPIGDPSSPEFFFCGGKALTGLPYCAHHSRVAYQPAGDRRRQPPKPTTVSLKLTPGDARERRMLADPRFSQSPDRVVGPGSCGSFARMSATS